MYSDRWVDITAIGLMAAVTAVGVLRWGQLPSELVVHWSVGQPDTAVAKPLAIFGLFAFGVLTVLFTRFAPDSWTNTPGNTDLTVLFLGVVFAWAQGIVIVWNLGHRFNVLLAVVPILLLALVLVLASRRPSLFG